MCGVSRKRSSEFSVDLDRIEEGIAVLLAPEGYQWHLPEDLLPEGAREGMTLKVSLSTDPASTSARMERIRRLREGLGGR